MPVCRQRKSERRLARLHRVLSLPSRCSKPSLTRKSPAAISAQIWFVSCSSLKNDEVQKLLESTWGTARETPAEKAKLIEEYKELVQNKKAPKQTCLLVEPSMPRLANSAMFCSVPVVKLAPSLRFQPIESGLFAQQYCRSKFRSWPKSINRRSC